MTVYSQGANRASGKKKRRAKKRAASLKKKRSPKKKRAASPKKRAVSPKKRAVSSKKRAVSPKKRAVSPKKKRAASPKRRAASSKKKRAASPKKRRAASPKKRAASKPKKRVLSQTPAAKRARARRAELKRLREERQARLDAVDEARREVREDLTSTKADEKRVESLVKKTEAQFKKETESRWPSGFALSSPQAIQEIWEKHSKKLMRLAERTMSERDRGRRRGWKEKVISNDRKGEVFHRVIKMVVDDAGVEEILYRVAEDTKKLKGKDPHWMASMTFTALGDAIVGYGNRVLDAGHAHAHEFQMGFETTGVFRSKEGMMTKLRSVLEDYAGERTTVICLNRYSIWNVQFGWRRKPASRTRHV